MINLHEKKILFTMATSSQTYGSRMPALIDGQWICPHCRFEHDDIDQLAAHMANSCDDAGSLTFVALDDQTRRPTPIFDPEEEKVEKTQETS